jgi:hypothetical protein
LHAGRRAHQALAQMRVPLSTIRDELHFGFAVGYAALSANLRCNPHPPLRQAAGSFYERAAAAFWAFFSLRGRRDLFLGASFAIFSFAGAAAFAAGAGLGVAADSVFSAFSFANVNEPLLHFTLLERRLLRCLNCVTSSRDFQWTETRRFLDAVLTQF